MDESPPSQTLMKMGKPFCKPFGNRFHFTLFFLRFQPESCKEENFFPLIDRQTRSMI